MRAVLALLAASVAALPAPPARAQTPAPETPPPVAPVSLPPPAPESSPSACAGFSPGGYPEVFGPARERFLAGDFPAALPGLACAVERAPSPTDRAVAQALLDAARDWTTRGLVFVAAAEVGDADLTAKAQDRRSTGEIAALYGVAISYGIGTGGYLAVLNESTSRAGVFLPMLGLAAGSVGAVYLADHPKPLRYGTPTAIGAGLSLGLLEGTLWTGYYQAQATALDELSGKAMATLIWAPATAGAVIGGVLGEQVGTTPGRAALTAQAGSLSAAFTGLVLSTALWDDRKIDDFALLGAALAANAGAVGGYFLGRETSPSQGRVGWLSVGALGGASTVALLDLAFLDDFRLFGATTAAGLAAGAGLAWVLTDGLPRDVRKGPQEGATADLMLLPQPGGGALALTGAF